MIRSALILLLLASVPAFAQEPTPPKPTGPTEVEQALELFKANKVPEALEKLTKAGKTNPNLSPPKVQVAQWCLRAGNGPAARTFIEQAIVEDPKHPDGYLLNAQFAFGEGRLTDAVLNLKTALEMAGDARWDADQKKRFVREARNGLVETSLTRGDYPAAKEYALEMLNADSKNGMVRAKLATCLFRLDKPAEAEKEFTQAFADDSTLDPPELLLANQWQQRAASETDPAKQTAHLEKVESWLQKAVSAHPKNAKPPREYGQWLLNSGKIEAAGPYIEAATKIDPTGKDTTVARALWLLHKKDAVGAEPLLDGVYKDNPGDLNALSYLCLCLSETGDEKKKKRAVDLADSLVRQNPKSAGFYAVLGWCQYKLGRTDDAEKAYNIAVSGGQAGPDTAYFIARLLNDRQKYEEAQKLLTLGLSTRHGMFLCRAEAKELLAEVTKKLPEKKEEKKDDKKEEKKVEKKGESKTP